MREVLARRGALLSSRTRPTSTAKDDVSVVHLEIERPPYAFEERRQSGESVNDKGEGVIGKCCGSSFPAFLSTPGPD